MSRLNINIKFRLWLETQGQDQIEYAWTRQISNFKAEPQFMKFFSLAIANPHKPLMGMVWLSFIPQGAVHKIENILKEMPNGVILDDGWNHSFHDSQYGTPSLVVCGKHHKEIRTKLTDAYNLVLQVAQPCATKNVPQVSVATRRLTYATSKSCIRLAT